MLLFWDGLGHGGWWGHGAEPFGCDSGLARAAGASGGPARLRMARAWGGLMVGHGGGVGGWDGRWWTSPPRHD
jgi:hypothetical protein